MAHVQINSIKISPPLINSSCAWASSYEQIEALYQSKFTGAVTIRTCTIDGFKEDSRHKVAFSSDGLCSINSYGYSPHSLSEYLEWILRLTAGEGHKPFILSIPTCELDLFRLCITMIQEFRKKHKKIKVAIEINASCPNIPGHPPPAYNLSEMNHFVAIVRNFRQCDESLTVGVKLPPYVYAGQIQEAVDCLIKEVDFLTCSNTLGNGLLFANQVASGSEVESDFALGPESSIGGLAGPAIHALALGNVHTFAKLMRQSETRSLPIIGVGGVHDAEGVKRMHTAGAAIVGLATALGKHGAQIFEMLSEAM